MALRAGVRVLYHCTYADAEALDMLEAAKDEIFVAPAIGVIVATPGSHPAAAYRHVRDEGGRGNRSSGWRVN